MRANRCSRGSEESGLWFYSEVPERFHQVLRLVAVLCDVATTGTKVFRSCKAGGPVDRCRQLRFATEALLTQTEGHHLQGGVCRRRDPISKLCMNSAYSPRSSIGGTETTAVWPRA